MRVAVVSDIHSNMEGLRAVLEDIASMGADQIISLGDNIGYGPEPEAVIQALGSLDISSVLGNHEQALLDAEAMNCFNPSAKKALKINKALLSIPSMERISRCKPFKIFNQARFVHGLPPDSISGYISKVPLNRLARIMETQKESLTFVGHTHELAVYELGPKGIKCKKFWKTRVSLDKASKYIINSGSVGQPRDSHDKATYVIWDSTAHSVESRAVSYDTLSTVQMMKQAGIPQVYGDLLLPGYS
jgi:predicted phosphodiesterase